MVKIENNRVHYRLLRAKVVLVVQPTSSADLSVPVQWKPTEDSRDGITWLYDRIQLAIPEAFSSSQA